MTTPEGEQVEIDVEMVPVAAQLWRLGFRTDMCCQDTGEYMLHGMPANAPDDREEAASRIMGRAWVRVPDDQAEWLMATVESLNSNGEWRVFRQTNREGWTSITFPKEQIPALVDLLST